MEYKPHDYQSYATEFILSHPVAAILLQMGLGKSVITLTAMQELFRRGEIRKYSPKIHLIAFSAVFPQHFYMRNTVEQEFLRNDPEALFFI